jgi:malonyl-CoA O-methyltransferase
MGAALCRFAETQIGKFVIRVSAIEGHRLWAPSYDSEPNPLIALERRVTSTLLKSLRPKTVVDVACGTGRWLLHFQQGGSNVFGLDVCAEMLSQAVARPCLRGHVTVADSEFIPFRSAAADLVVCSLSLAYFENIDRVFAECARITKPGSGFLIVTDLHPDALRAGWKRSFRRGQNHYDISHQSRTVQHVEHAAEAAGLKLRVSQTSYFGVPELPIFQRAGKAEQFWKITRIPALFVRVWEKPW